MACPSRPSSASFDRTSAQVTSQRAGCGQLDVLEAHALAATGACTELVGAEQAVQHVFKVVAGL
jgi:hypothetical protein